MTLESRWRDELERLRAGGRYRQLTPPAGTDFSSNDYLGYGKRSWPARDGTRSGTASRLLRGHDRVWDELEAVLARWHGAEAALVFTSGYTANEGLLSAAIAPADWVASDQLNHASLIDGLRLSKAERYVYRHNDLNHLEAGLRRAAEAPDRQRFIVTESLFGMDGDRTPLTDLAGLAERYGAYLILDEAHATGCLGPSGSGLVDGADLRDRVLATVHTGGKALGVPGGYVVGSARLKEWLVNRCRHFIYTTALPPIVGGWWLDAVARAKADERARADLAAAVRRFRSALGRQGIRAGGADYVVPIVLGDDAFAVDVAAQLRDAGFDVRAVRPPTVPEGTARLRVSVHADHDATTLDRLAHVLGSLIGAPQRA